MMLQSYIQKVIKQIISQIYFDFFVRLSHLEIL